jgi:hypothetical protein
MAKIEAEERTARSVMVGTQARFHGSEAAATHTTNELSPMYRPPYTNFNKDVLNMTKTAQ